MPYPYFQIIRARLIADWRRGHRLWSMRLSAFSAIIMGAYDALPREFRDLLPFAHHLAAGLFVAIALSRLIAQEPKV